MHNKFKSFAIALGSAVTLSLSALSPVFAQEQTPSVSMYRLYNKNTGEHFYTADTNERQTLINLGWKDEGIGWYSDDAKTVPMYREYNPNAKIGTHNYTCQPKEHASLILIGWKDENIAWYAVESGAPIEKGHFEQVWIEGKTERVPIYEEKIFWICSNCSYKIPVSSTSGEEMKDHWYQHALKGEGSSFYSKHEDVVVGYNTVETPGHYEWKWVAE